MDELEELFLNAKNKDIKSFEKLILNMKNDLYRIGQTRLDNDEDINDAVQETGSSAIYMKLFLYNIDPVTI